MVKVKPKPKLNRAGSARDGAVLGPWAAPRLGDLAADPDCPHPILPERPRGCCHFLARGAKPPLDRRFRALDRPERLAVDDVCVAALVRLVLDVAAAAASGLGRLGQVATAEVGAEPFQWKGEPPRGLT